MHKMEELPQTRFTCPRCGKSGSIAATFVVQKAECGDCKLALVAGPDRKLHGVREAAELHRAAKATAPRRYREWLEANFRRADGRLHRGYVVSVAGLTIALALTAGYLVRSLLDNSPETLALRLTAKCLAGDFKSAERYLPDDDVQRVEFERWRMRHFASIIQKFRPAGDRVGMGATPLEQLASKATFQIEMQSDFFGARRLKQVWVCDEDGIWRFDVCETLAVEDGQHAPRTAPTESATVGMKPKR
jgi:ribosomal protein S27AE